MKKKAKKASAAKRGRRARMSAKAMHDHETEACLCDFDDAAVNGTPDADLPAAKGGVAGATKSSRRAGARA